VISHQSSNLLAVCSSVIFCSFSLFLSSVTYAIFPAINASQIYFDSFFVALFVSSSLLYKRMVAF